MTLDDVGDWKTRLLTPIYAKINERAATPQGGPTFRPDTRLAVGYSRQKKEYCLELRVQRKDGPAWKKAQKVRDDFPNDVNIVIVESVEVAPIRAVLENNPYAKQLGPLCLGASVSHRDDTAPGSLGAFVQDEEGSTAILSASHVLALGGTAREKDRIVHPGIGDVRQLVNRNLIGRLGQFTVLSAGGANTLDAAYAHLEANIEYLGNVVPTGVGAPKAVEGQRIKFDPKSELGEDEGLAKVGRTTGYTEGILNAINVDNVSVLVPGIGLVYFNSCLEVRWKSDEKPFTLPGDSGSAVFTTKEGSACGIHFAGGVATRDGKQFKVSYACDLAEITSLFNLAWLSDE